MQISIDWQPEAIRAYEEKVEEQARILTSQYTNHLLSENIKTEAAIVKGDPRQIVLEYVEKYQPAAVVMGTRGLGLLKRYTVCGGVVLASAGAQLFFFHCSSLLGSVSDYVLHNSEAPVIVVREGEANK